MQKLRKKQVLTACMNPSLDPSEHPPSLVNIVTGTMASKSAHVDQAIDISKIRNERI